MGAKKLLVYSDGGLFTMSSKQNPTPRVEMYGSYAAYFVPLESSWGMVPDNMGWAESEETVASRHFALLKEEEPVVHVKRVSLLLGDRERATNNLAEAKTLKKAAQCARWLVERNSDIEELEFCMDSRIVMNTVLGVFGKAKSDIGFKGVANDVRSVVCNIPVKKTTWSWINGDVMKHTIIGH